MKSVILLIAVVGLAAARPQKPDEVTITRSEHNVEDDGSFNWVSETSDGTLVSQRGYIKNPQEPDQEKRIIALEGEFSYISEGQPIRVTYVADENGFVPQGDHLPTAPPTPDHVLKTLQILNANAAQQVRAARQS